MSQTITAIEVQKKNQGRVNIYLDGKFAFGLTRIVAAWLKVGQEISDEKIAQLLSKETNEQAYQRAINYLSYRPRSEAEIRINLQKKFENPAVIEEILSRLKENKLVDDRNFAEAWISNRNDFSPRGRRALRYELRRKHIEESIIEEALDGVDEETLAYQAAHRRATRYQHLEKKEFGRKLSGFLARRGFHYGTIKPIIERLWNDLNNKPTTT